VAFKRERVGKYIQLEKGISYKGVDLVDESDTGLLTINAFVPGGGYKYGSEKPYAGPVKESDLLEAGDILMATTEQDEGLLASTLLMPEGIDDYAARVFSLDVAKVRTIEDGLSPEFLHNYLRIPLHRTRFAYGDTGSTVQRLPFEAVYEQEIPTPPVEIQEQINKLMRLFDMKIQKNVEVSQSLENFGLNLFTELFRNFDSAGLEKIQAETGHELVPSSLLSLITEPKKESSIGLIPEGWTETALDEVNGYLNGAALQKFPLKDGEVGLPAIKITQLKAGHTRRADIVSSSVPEKYKIIDGDTLFSWSASLEVESWTGGDGALNQHLFKVTGKTVPQWYAHYSTKSFITYFREIAESKVTTMGHIQRGHITESKVALPPASVIEKFTPLMDSVLKLKVASLVENRYLVSYRDSILKKMLNDEFNFDRAGLE
jgi:type I restriction enzyme S subunit